MTSREKVAVSLPADLLAAAREAVARGEAPSLSRYVADALALRQRQEALDDVLVQMATEGSPPTEQDVAWVKRVLAH